MGDHEKAEMKRHTLIHQPSDLSTSYPGPCNLTSQQWRSMHVFPVFTNDYKNWFFWFLVCQRHLTYGVSKCQTKFQYRAVLASSAGYMTERSNRRSATRQEVTSSHNLIMSHISGVERQKCENPPTEFKILLVNIWT